MKSIFEDLDTLIEQAVESATKNEKILQDKQTKLVKKHGLNSKVKDDKVEEADDEEAEKKKDDESIPKIGGKTSNEPSSDSKSSTSKDVTPGTRTSKKLLDPPEKVLTNPQFSDIRDKVNALRGTSSLRDETVSSNVKKYLASLTNAEKGALLTYLTNLAQVMAPVRSADQVDDPGEKGIKITFSKELRHKEKKEPAEKEKKSKSDGVIVVGDK